VIYNFWTSKLLCVWLGSLRFGTYQLKCGLRVVELQCKASSITILGKVAMSCRLIHSAALWLNTSGLWLRSGRHWGAHRHTGAHQRCRWTCFPRSSAPRCPFTTTAGCFVPSEGDIVPKGIDKDACVMTVAIRSGTHTQTHNLINMWLHRTRIFPLPTELLIPIL